jgi:hypothetical protein
MTDSVKWHHDTQNNDILHHKKLSVTFSIMTLSMMAVLLCCVSFMPSVSNKTINISIVVLNVITLGTDKHSSLLRVESY